MWKGVKVIPYMINRRNSKDAHPWIIDLEAKIVRREACYDAAMALKKKGFSPDIILAHHGWGESLFLKDVWPEARMGLYCEFFHHADDNQIGFDPEFPRKNNAKDALRLRVRNLNNHLHFRIAEAGISLTHFQADTFPAAFRDQITVMHDGVDTGLLVKNADAVLKVSDSLSLTRNDEVITFINRNLEPYRGYHQFMRALPKLLKLRPDAHVVLLGGNEVSYGEKAPEGKTWKQIYIDEVKDQISEQDWARVHFMGRVPYESFLAMLQVSRVHVYLTYPFVLSWSLLEAMSAECAIVASDTAPVKEAIIDGKNGVLVDFFDPLALAAKVDHLLNDPQRRERLGRTARETIVKNYDLRSHCLPQTMAWVDRLSQLPVKAFSKT